MSRENVEIVRRVYEGVSAHLDPPRDLYGPDYEVDASDVAPDFGVIRGLEASLDAFRPYWETFDDFRVEMLGKLAHLSIHTDRKRAFEAMGLSEHDAHADS